jgi:hypothetical protein
MCRGGMAGAGRCVVRRQRGAVRCGAVRCGAARCGAVRCGAVRCGAVRCAALRCAALRCAALRCAALRCAAVWGGVGWCSVGWGGVVWRGVGSSACASAHWLVPDVRAAVRRRKRCSWSVCGARFPAHKCGINGVAMLAPQVPHSHPANDVDVSRQRAPVWHQHLSSTNRPALRGTRQRALHPAAPSHSAKPRLRCALLRGCPWCLGRCGASALVCYVPVCAAAAAHVPSCLRCSECVCACAGVCTRGVSAACACTCAHGCARLSRGTLAPAADVAHHRRHHRRACARVRCVCTRARAATTFSTFGRMPLTTASTSWTWRLRVRIGIHWKCCIGCMCCVSVSGGGAYHAWRLQLLQAWGARHAPRAACCVHNHTTCARWWCLNASHVHASDAGGCTTTRPRSTGDKIMVRVRHNLMLRPFNVVRHLMPAIVQQLVNFPLIITATLDTVQVPAPCRAVSCRVVSCRAEHVHELSAPAAMCDGGVGRGVRKCPRSCCIPALAPLDGLAPPWWRKKPGCRVCDKVSQPEACADLRTTRPPALLRGGCRTAAAACSMCAGASLFSTHACTHAPHTTHTLALAHTHTRTHTHMHAHTLCDARTTRLRAAARSRAGTRT